MAGIFDFSKLWPKGGNESWADKTKSVSGTGSQPSGSGYQVTYHSPGYQYSYKPSLDVNYIIQKLDNTYLTLKKDGTIVFEPLHEENEKSSQKWILYGAHKVENEEPYKKLGYKNIKEIVPFNDQKKVLCINEDGTALELKPETTKSTCTYWEFQPSDGTTGLHRYNNKFYDSKTQFKILSAKFLGKFNAYTPFTKVSDPDEVSYLTVQPYSKIDIKFEIKNKNGVISYDFDGVLHLSIKCDPYFHRDIKDATYHPLEFSSSDLIPYVENIVRLRKEAQDYQIIVVTARPESSDKYVREFLTRYGILQYIDEILYISKKTPFLKAINVVRHYDDSPKQILPMLEAGINAILINPSLNTLYDYQKEMLKKIIDEFPVEAPKSSIVSYDFDGVLHLSIKPSPDFYRKVEEAVYSPLDSKISELIPYRENLVQLVEDAVSDYQVIIVTGRSKSEEKVVVDFLTRYGVMEYIKEIHYDVADKVSFLKKLGVVKHYEDSPKYIFSMMMAGITVIQVNPPLNRYWFPDEYEKGSQEEEMPAPGRGTRRQVREASVPSALGRGESRRASVSAQGSRQQRGESVPSAPQRGRKQVREARRTRR